MAGIEHLVGRDETVERLRAALDQALAARGQVVLVAGEPGIGKTAVLSALAAEAEGRSTVVSWGQCWDNSMAPAFWPWTQVLREFDHGELLSGGHGRTAVDESGDRFDLFDRARTCLIEASVAHGVVVLLDDLQWADEASLALLSFVAQHVQRARLLIVGAFRDLDAGPSLTRLMGDVEVITIQRLAEHDAAQLTHAIAGQRLQPDAVADVVRRAGGNPLYVRELTRLVIAGRVSAREPVPQLAGGVRDVVTQRAARLSPACRRMLDVAAVVGADIRVDVLSRTLGGRDDLTDLLAEAIEARILVARADELAPVTFAHDLFREVLGLMLSPATKAQMHLTVARTLDELRADGAPITNSSLAAHYVAAASLGLRPAAVAAVEHSQRAAVEAVEQLAFDDAVGHLRRALVALQLADRPDPGVRLDLLLSLASALDQSGEAPGARRALLEAADLAGQLADSDGFARAAIAIHQLGALSGLSRPDNVRRLEEAVTGLASRATALRARTLASLARELHHTWDPDVGERDRAFAVEAVILARQLDDPATLGYCLLALHDTMWSVGSAAERQPIVEEMLDVARVGNDRQLAAQAQLLKATALLERGDPSAAVELERYCRAADDLSTARGRWGAQTRRAVLALLAGQFDEAAALGADAAQLGDDIGEPDTPGVRDTLLWEIARFRDGWAQFVPEAHWVPPGTWPPMRAVLLAARGDRQAAQAALAGYSLRQDRQHGLRRHDGWMPMIIAGAVLVAGRDAQQTEVYDWLRPLAGNHLVYGGCMGYGGAVDHHLGTLAAALGRHDDAVTHLRTALSMHERVGAVAWAALDRSSLADDQPPALGAADISAVDASNALLRNGDAWQMTFRGRTSTVRHVKGMDDLAVLLSRPGREVPALELMGGVDVGGSPGPVLDEQARRAYQTRIRDLEVEIDEAKAASDWTRADRAEAQLDALVEQLSQAFGLGGRHRVGGAAGERARAAVTHRIRGAVRRIADVDPALGQHLFNAIKTGTWCSYRPDTDMEWTVHGEPSR